MELRLRFFFLSIRFFVRFWFYLFLFLFVFFVRFWMTEPNAHLAPNRLRSLCSCRIRRARRRSPLQNASAEIGGRSSATPGFCHCSDPICDSCNAFNLFNALTLPWPTEALAKDATLLPWRSLRFLIQHCHRALVQGLRFLMRIANRSQPCSSQLSQSTHHVKDHTGLARLIEVQIVPHDNVEKIVRD